MVIRLTREGGAEGGLGEDGGDGAVAGIGESHRYGVLSALIAFKREGRFDLNR